MMAADVKNREKQKKLRLTQNNKWQKLMQYAAFCMFGYEGEAQRSIALRKRYLYSLSRAALGVIFCALVSKCQLAFSIYPFGIAFVASSGRLTPIYAAAALICSLTLGSRAAIYAVAILLILLLRTLACLYLDSREEGVGRFPIYSELSAYRIVFSCVAAFTVGIYNLFFYDFSYYALLGSLLIMAATPISTYIFIYALEPQEYCEHRDIARLFLCSVLVWSLGGVSIGIISLADICSFLLIVNETKKKKCAYCAIMGLAVGLPSGIAGAALYALAGVVCFLLSSLSSTLGCIGAFTFLVMAEGYTGGYGALVSSLGGSSVGLGVALLMQKYSIREKMGILWLDMIDIESKQHEPALSVGEASAHISDISDTFSSLSRMLRSLSVYSERSHVLDTRAIVEGVCDEVCTECKRRSVCYTQRASDTADMMQKLAHTLSRTANLTKEALPEHIQRNCIRIDKLVSRAREKMASAVEQTLSGSGCKLLASDYEAMSRILECHLEKTKEKSTLDKALSSELYELCQRKRWGIGHISVWGKRIKKIYATDIDLSSHTASARQLSESFGRVCKTRLCSPVYSIDESEVELEMHSIPTLSARCSIACAAKDGERECGDSSRSFLNGEGYFYSVLCDGMGSGREAAYTSAISVEYIASMLEHSNPKELTVEMLNAVLRERSGECSSTLDLFELDTYTGEGCFIKSGAAPSFVCRSKNVYKIQAKTIPIGITERIRAEKIKFKLRAGDVVVMASDGVTEGADRTRRIIELLCARPSDEPLDIAAHLLSAIKDESGAEDDMTVSVTVVEPYREE